MIYDDYFTNDDKPFSENINTALLLANVFDMTVPIELPTMFSNGEFVDTTGRRKCSVAITQIVDNDDLTINAGSIVGTGSLDLKFYPNFNSYGGISRVDWVTSSGTVTVDIYDASDNLIASDIPNGVLDVQSTSIKTLQNFKFRLNFTSATLTSFKVTMVNKDTDRWGAEVGISDVTGLQASLDAKLDKSSVHFVTLTASSYNVTIDNSVTLTCKVTDSTGSPIEDYEVQLYKNGVSLGNDYKSDTDENGEATFTYTCTDWGVTDFSIEKTHCQVNVTGWKTYMDSSGFTMKYNQTWCVLSVAQESGQGYSATWEPINNVVQIPAEGLRPTQPVISNVFLSTNLLFAVREDGKFYRRSMTGSSVTAGCYLEVSWRRRDAD